MKKPPRLEWISVIYLVFFVLAVLSPSIHTRDMLGLSETQLEELTIFAFGIAGLVTFAAYERVMEGREKESEEREHDYSRAKRELIESYAYIGSVNRKIELLKKAANETSKTVSGSGPGAKDVLMALAMNAGASVGAEGTLIRFVEHERLRTEREYLHAAGRDVVFRVPNKDLKGLHDKGLSHAFIRSEDGEEVLVVPSDHTGTTKAYALLKLDSGQIRELDVSLLKVFVNQAELLYRQFQHA